MACIGRTRIARRSIRIVSQYRWAAADAADVRRRGAPVQLIRVSRWVRSMFDVRRIRALGAARRPGPAVLSQSVCRIGDRHYVERKRRRNSWRRSSLFAGKNLTNLLDAVFVADLSLALASSMIAGKAPAVLLASRRQNKKPKETLSRMIRNQKPPAVRQQVLFSTVVQQVVDLPTDKQRELQTAVAELLLHALTVDDFSDRGEADDESQAHA